MSRFGDLCRTVQVIGSCAASPHAVFDPTSGALFSCSTGIAATIRAVQGCGPSATLSPQLAAGVLEAVVREIQEARERATIKRTSSKQDGHSSLGKLVMLLSTSCSLQCKYCYASGGNYGLPIANMSSDTVRTVFSTIYGAFSRLGMVQFFGGEPLLNPASLWAACAEATSQARSRGVPPPRFGMVTNLFNMPDSLPALVQRYDVSITVSLDGPAEVNDHSRVTRHGEGTHAAVVSNIRHLRRLTSGKEPSAVEATYTDKHAELGITHQDLYRFFRETFGFRRILIIPALAPGRAISDLPRPGSDLHEAPDCEDVTGRIQDLLEGGDCLSEVDLTWIGRFTRPFQHYSSRFCSAGFDQLSVTPTGDIFPCHLFSIAKEFNMGNIQEGLDVFTGDQFHRVQDRLDAVRKGGFRECSACWISGFCKRCLGAELLARRRLDIIDQQECESKKRHAEQVALAICQIGRSQDMLEVFADRIRSQVGAGEGAWMAK